MFPVRSSTEATNRHLENRQYRHEGGEGKRDRTGQKARRCLKLLFYYSNGIVHMEFIPEGATLNKHRHKEILGFLRDSIRRKRPQL